MEKKEALDYLKRLGFKGTEKRYGLALNFYEEAEKRADYILSVFEKYLNQKIENKSILELGSGTGNLCISCSRKNKNVVGVEINNDMLQFSLKGDKNKKCTFLKADAQNLPFKENSFDIVFAVDILEHVKSSKKVVDESQRVLKKQGLFLAKVGNFWFPYEPHTSLLGVQFLPKQIADIIIKKLRKEFFYNNKSYSDIHLKSYLELKNMFKNWKLKIHKDFILFPYVKKSSLINRVRNVFKILLPKFFAKDFLIIAEKIS